MCGTAVEFFLDSSRDTGSQRTGRNPHPFGRHTAGSQYGLLADCGVMQDDGVHADQRAVFHHAPFQHGAVPNRYVIPDERDAAFWDMQGSIVLHIAAAPNDDATMIAAHDCAIPDTCPFSNLHVADDHGGGCNKHIGCNLGRAALVGDDHQLLSSELRLTLFTKCTQPLLMILCPEQNTLC